MKLKRFNWQIWAGFLLSVFGFLSYPLIFAEWPVTRDFPWVNLLLFGIAALLLFLGIRRAFERDRGRLSKIGASLITALGAVVFGFFILTVFISSKWLPESVGAPQVGQTAPDFTLTDTNGGQVSLSDLLTTPMQPRSTAPKGVLLIFYRGYW